MMCILDTPTYPKLLVEKSLLIYRVDYTSPVIYTVSRRVPFAFPLSTQRVARERLLLLQNYSRRMQ